MIRLIATDIDGTLLDSNRYVSNKTIQVLCENCIQIPKVLISARMPSAMYYLQEALDIKGSPIVAYNGGLILHNDEVLSSTLIPLTMLKTIAKTIEHTDLHLGIYVNDNWFVPAMDHWAKREINNTRVTPTVQDVTTTIKNLIDEGSDNPEEIGVHKIMLMGDAVQMEEVYNLLKNQVGEEIHLYRSKDTYTEIAPSSISKKTALELLLLKVYKDIAIEEVAAFGDNYNDIEMIKAVGYGVAVANARKELLDVCNYKTDTNKNDGVANWLETNFN